MLPVTKSSYPALCFLNSPLIFFLLILLHLHLHLHQFPPLGPDVSTGISWATRSNFLIMRRNSVQVQEKEEN
jgi:hypothetical protein